MNVISVKQLINVMTANEGITVAELSRKLNVSPQFLNNRIKTQKFSIDEWTALCRACGCDFELHVYSKYDDIDIFLKPVEKDVYSTKKVKKREDVRKRSKKVSAHLDEPKYDKTAVDTGGVIYDLGMLGVGVEDLANISSVNDYNEDLK